MSPMWGLVSLSHLWDRWQFPAQEELELKKDLDLGVGDEVAFEALGVEWNPAG